MSEPNSEYYRKGINVEHVGTIPDIATMLGITSQYIHRMRSEGEFDVEPVAKLGRSLVYRYDEAEAWLKRKRMASTRRRLNTTYGGHI